MPWAALLAHMLHRQAAPPPQPAPAWLVSTDERGVLSVRARVGVTAGWQPPGSRCGLASLPSERFTSPAPGGRVEQAAWFVTNNVHRRSPDEAARQSPGSARALPGPGAAAGVGGCTPAGGRGKQQRLQADSVVVAHKPTAICSAGSSSSEGKEHGFPVCRRGGSGGEAHAVGGRAQGQHSRATQPTPPHHPSVRTVAVMEQRAVAAAGGRVRGNSGSEARQRRRGKAWGGAAGRRGSHAACRRLTWGSACHASWARAEARHPWRGRLGRNGGVAGGNVVQHGMGFRVLGFRVLLIAPGMRRRRRRPACPLTFQQRRVAHVADGQVRRGRGDGLRRAGLRCPRASFPGLGEGAAGQLLQAARRGRLLLAARGGGGATQPVLHPLSHGREVMPV